MSLSKRIEEIKNRLRQGIFTSEAAVSQGILLPVLSDLGWPVSDISIVVPEYSLEGRRVDYALCHPANRPSVFIEVKKVDFLNGADRQLFEYAFHEGVPMAILTDGKEWSFYLPGEQGHYDERRVYKLDLLERSVEEAVNRLEKYLSYENVCSGKALNAARSDYKNVSRDREIESTLPRAWNAILEEQDSSLLELLAEKVELFCGYKPDLDLCSQFLDRSSTSTTPIKTSSPTKSKFPSSSTRLQTKREAIQPQSSMVDNFSFEFNGKTYEARSARSRMTEVFKLFAKEDVDFLERFSSRKHGRKRRYIARNRQELYPGRPDLAEHSVPIASGWWLSTNYSRKNIEKIVNLALEVVHPDIRSAIRLHK